MSSYKYRKHKDPEFNPQSIIEPSNTNTPEPIDMNKVYQLSAEYRQKKLEETPRLEEFENTVRQYVNDYIVYQTNSAGTQGKVWNPTLDSIYFCYTRIKNELIFNTDKEFRDWFAKTSIEDIRRIISHEISTYIQYRKLHSQR